MRYFILKRERYVLTSKKSTIWGFKYLNKKERIDPSKQFDIL